MGLEFYVEHSYLIPLLPLIGALISGFLGAKWLKGQSHWPIWIGVGASALLSIGLLVATINLKEVHASHGGHEPIGATAHWFNWINAGSFKAEAGAWIDPLTAVMLTVVCGIGFFICVANLCAKKCTKRGMSSGRSRSGGTVIGKTFRR